MIVGVARWNCRQNIMGICGAAKIKVFTTALASEISNTKHDKAGAVFIQKAALGSIDN
jgi:hypothetical protein